MLDEGTETISPYARLAFRLSIFILAIIVGCATYYVVQVYSPEHVSLLKQSQTNNEVSVQVQMNAGHVFKAPGEINNQAVQFLIDTGASSVSIPLKYTKKLGLKLGNQVQLSTAAGKNIGYRTTINKLSIGKIHLYHVPAIVSPQADNNYILFGMSAIKNLEFNIKNQILTLRQKKAE